MGILKNIGIVLGSILGIIFLIICMFLALWIDSLAHPRPVESSIRHFAPP